MPTTDLVGRPTPAAAILFVMDAVWLVAAEPTALTAALLSGYLPTLSASLKTYFGAAPAPAAVVLAPPVGVDEPPAVLPPLLWVRWMTRNTIATTPITDAARYRTIRAPPGRCGDRVPPDRDRFPGPGEAKLSSSYPGAAGASKPGWPYPSGLYPEIGRAS